MAEWAEPLRENGLPDWFQDFIELYVNGVSREISIEDGLEWNALMKDEELRRRSLIALATLMRRRDAAVGDAWLETSPLTEEEREKVRSATSDD